MRIAVVTIHMGTGLAISARILATQLGRLGHDVEIHDLRNDPPTSSPDCTIFFERFKPEWMGRFNMLVPNPEFLQPADLPFLSRFDLIVCKTRHVMRLIKTVPPERKVHIGFTSLDRYRPQVERKRDQFLHIAGCSAQKGTDAVLSAWYANPDFPMLNVIDWGKQRQVRERPNIQWIRERLSDDELVELVNRCAVHLCPSTAEGFGHTLNEALSCGAVLVTTDAEPMNERTKKCAILVPPVSQRPMGIATAYHVDGNGIARAVRTILAMSPQERRQLGAAARTQWEINCAGFLVALEKLTKLVERRRRSRTGVMRSRPGMGFGSNQFRT